MSSSLIGVVLISATTNSLGDAESFFTNPVMSGAASFRKAKIKSLLLSIWACRTLLNCLFAVTSKWKLAYFSFRILSSQSFTGS